MQDPIHDFWILGKEFYAVSVHLFNPKAGSRNTIEVFGIVEDVAPSERNAVLDAIADWNIEHQPVPAPSAAAVPTTEGIPYKITGLRSNMMELSDPTGIDNAMDGDFRFVLTVRGVEYPVDVHAKLVMGSNLFDRLVEVYPPQLPPGINLRADELHDAVRRYMFAFLNTEEALSDFRDKGVFSFA